VVGSTIGSRGEVPGERKPMTRDDIITTTTTTTTRGVVVRTSHFLLCRILDSNLDLASSNTDQGFFVFFFVTPGNFWSTGTLM
jgi:hypothetical protein